jgi:uncharacterized protein (DUF1684 family)
MKSNFVILALLLVFNGSLTIVSGQEIVPAKNYIESIENERKGKNIEFMYTDKSPLPPEIRKSFKGLDYFPIDKKYRVEAILIKDSVQKTIVMKTSTSRAPEYIKYGLVKFQIDTFHLELSVFQYSKLLEQPNQERHLFIPFRDETTSLETYGGGRYIDSEIPEEGNELILDFNKAYNPYCAYNHKYSCVVPPDENQLPVRVEAGEKVFEE